MDQQQPGESTGRRLTLAPEPPEVLSTHHLSKEFGAVRAVDDLELTVRRGDVFGFLGPNGAGKTTTIRMIVGLIYPTAGYVKVLDYRVPEQRKEALRHIGGFVEIPAFYANMSARRNLRLLGSLSGDVSDGRINEVLDIVGLRERAGSRVGDYSHGMKQRLGIANALLTEPDLVILDEPTSGLDPHQIIEIRELIKELGKTKTIVFSSHILQEVSAICSRIIIIKEGRVIADGTPKDLQDRASGGRTYRVRIQGPAEAVKLRLSGFAGVESASLVEEAGGFGEYQVRASDGQDLGPEIFRAAKESGWTLAKLDEVERSLEDVYLQLTEKK